MNLVWKFAIAISLVCSWIAISGNRDRAKEGQQAHQALCAYVADLTERRNTARGYLEDPKQGDPITIPTVRVNGEPLQVSRGQLKGDVQAQTRVIHAYDGLDCKGE